MVGHDAIGEDLDTRESLRPPHHSGEDLLFSVVELHCPVHDPADDVEDAPIRRLEPVLPHFCVPFLVGVPICAPMVIWIGTRVHPIMKSFSASSFRVFFWNIPYCYFTICLFSVECEKIKNQISPWNLYRKTPWKSTLVVKLSMKTSGRSGDRLCSLHRGSGGDRLCHLPSRDSPAASSGHPMARGGDRLCHLPSGGSPRPRPGARRRVGSHELCLRARTREK